MGCISVAPPTIAQPFRDLRLGAGRCHRSRLFSGHGILRAKIKAGSTKTEYSNDSLRGSSKDSWRQNTSQSSWNAEQEGGERGEDYLYELGRQSANMNTDMGAKNSTGMVDILFTGGYLGRDADITSGELRKYEFRTLKHLEGDYYVPAAFVDKFAVHLVKNFLIDQNQLTGEVPLILGIWGGKGCGKTFMLELCCREMGITPIIMSAGELEDEWAGEPGTLIRNRYRRAAEVIKHGKMSCLIINDIDAGVGRFSDTQVTVNNQMVMGTLMNLCDDPNRVSVGQDWREDDLVRRVPIIVTGNDLSTLYAPILRDGRMEKFYWQPTKIDLLNMVETIFKDDGYTTEQVAMLMDTFPGQPLDFFGALRARMYDSSILQWTARIGDDVLPKVLSDLARVRWQKKAALVTNVEGFSTAGIDLSYERLIQQANDLVQEQQNINDHQLAHEYMRWQDSWVPPEKKKLAVTDEMLIEWTAAREALDVESKRRLEEARVKGEELRRQNEAKEKEYLDWLAAQPAPEPEPEPEPKAWEEVLPDFAVEVLMHEKDLLYQLIDIRGARDYNTEHAKGAVSAPSVEVTGRPLHWKRQPIEDDFVNNIQSQFPDVKSKIMILGYGDNEERDSGYINALMQRLASLGYSELVEVRGGYEMWLRFYSPGGKRRPREGKFMNDLSSGGTICVGSDFDPI